MKSIPEPTQYTSIEIEDLKNEYETNLPTTLDEAVDWVNRIVEIHKDHGAWIEQFENIGDWSAEDANEITYDVHDDIENLYKVALSKYHDMHWNEKGFNAYDVISS